MAFLLFLLDTTNPYIGVSVTRQVDAVPKTQVTSEYWSL